jgi:hypothetical protein
MLKDEPPMRTAEVLKQSRYYNWKTIKAIQLLTLQRTPFTLIKFQDHYHQNNYKSIKIYDTGIQFYNGNSFLGGHDPFL